MNKRFNYPKHFEKEKKIPRLRKKRIGIAEVSLGDFTGRLVQISLKKKNQSITKNQLLKVIEKSYLTSNVYIDTAIKKGYFRIIRNNKDKRSIFILPSVITIKTFEEFVDRRDALYRGIK